MPISDVEDGWLEGFFDRIEETNNLSEWESNFVDDQHTRYKTHRMDLYMSPKQWNVLFRIAVKKLDYELPDGKQFVE